MIRPVPKSVFRGDPLAAAWLEEMRAAVNARTPLPSPGIRYRMTPAGFHAQPIVKPGGSEEVSADSCPLGGMASGIVESGHVVGGGLTVLIEPTEIDPVPTSKSLFVKCTWTADEIDDVLQSGGTMNAVTLETPAATVPDDDVPIITSLSGIAYIVLGSWDADSIWVPNGCGTITLDFCPGGFLKGRGQ